MSREQGNKMLCWKGEGGRKPPCITESGLVVQRASLPLCLLGMQEPSLPLPRYSPTSPGSPLQRMWTDFRGLCTLCTLPT